MIVTVSTVKDTAENIETFVRRNLANGADAMIVFLEQPDNQVENLLAKNAHVLAINTDHGWWLEGERPDILNRRQTVNATCAASLLASHPWASWVFHIDADEVLRLDKPRLEQLPVKCEVVELRVLEAVSDAEGNLSGLFKRRLTKSQAVLAAQLGLMDSPDPHGHFHGHVLKSGMRPTTDRALAIHKTDPRPTGPGSVIRADHFNLLHFESASFAEFKRKWRNLAGTRSRFGTRRQGLAIAVEELMSAGLSEPALDKYLRRLYERHIQDGAYAELEELGFVFRLDPDEERYKPRVPPIGELARLRSQMEKLSRQDKVALRDGTAGLRRKCVRAL